METPRRVSTMAVFVQATWTYFLVVLIQLSVVDAAKSLLTNTEDGIPSKDCLGKEPIVAYNLPLLEVMLEENDWASHYVVTQIAAIIIREHLGHKVHINVPTGGTKRIFHRASMPMELVAADAAGGAEWSESDGDGTQLKNLMDKGSVFMYANFETWWGGKEESLTKFVETSYSNGPPVISGSLGYIGRDGWYMPRWISERCGGLAYPAWLPGNDEKVMSAFSNSKQTRSCSEAGEKDEFELWCREESIEEPQILVHTVGGYAGGVNEAIVVNNKMNIALQRWSSYSAQIAYVKNFLDVKENNTACSGSNEPESLAMAFYHWEPTDGTAFTSEALRGLERLILPTRECGIPSTESWRCDFQINRLMKIRTSSLGSAATSSPAPLLYMFFQEFSIKPDDMKAMLGTIKAVSHDVVFDVACSWVKSNKAMWSAWTHDRNVPREVPPFAYVWYPAVFFTTLLVILAVSIIWCVCLDSTFIAGTGGREDWYYRRDFSPVWRGRCTSKVAPVDDCKEVPRSIPQEPALDDTVFFASPIFFDDHIDPDDVTMYVSLIRVGDCSQAATVRLASNDGTAKAGSHYQAVDSEACFAPGECVKWVDISRIPNPDWTSELFFNVKIMEVLSGNVSIGNLSQCSVIYTDSRSYPGLREPSSIDTFRGQYYFVVGMIKEVMVNHGYVAECKNLMALLYEAVYSSLVQNYLYSYYFLDTCIGQSDYYGLFVIAGIEACHLGIKRLSSWTQAMCGSYGPRTECHQHAERKVTMPFFQDVGPEVENHFMNVHTFSVDTGVGRIYFSALSVYKSVLQVGISIAYIFGTSNAGANPLLLIYRFVPLVVLLPITVYFGFFWHNGPNWQMEIDSEVSNRDRLEKAMWILEARKTSKTYGTGYLTTMYDESFRASMDNYFEYCYSLFLHEMDSHWLSETFGELLVVALYVLFALLHLESKNFGAGDVSLGMVFSTISIYNLIRGATMNFCHHCRNIEDGIANVKSLRDLLDKETAIPDLNAQLYSRMEYMNLTGGLQDANALNNALDNGNGKPKTMLALNRRNKTMKCEFRDVEYTHGSRTCYFSGDIPLGAVYIMKAKAPKNEQDVFFQLLHGTQQPTQGMVLMPPFARCVGMKGSDLPELFHLSAIDNALAFADRRRYSEEDARVLLTALDVFGESTFSLSLSEDQLKDGDPLTGILDPSWVSKEDRALLILVQVIFSDPEILIFDKPLLYLPQIFHRRVLCCLLWWQIGGPEAVLAVGTKTMGDVSDKKKMNPVSDRPLKRRSTQGFSQMALQTSAKALSDTFESFQGETDGYKAMMGNDGYPEWFQRGTCSMKRTLILNLHRSADATYMANEFKNGCMKEIHMENGKIWTCGQTGETEIPKASKQTSTIKQRIIPGDTEVEI